MLLSTTPDTASPPLALVGPVDLLHISSGLFLFLLGVFFDSRKGACDCYVSGPDLTSAFGGGLIFLAVDRLPVYLWWKGLRGFCHILVESRAFLDGDQIQSIYLIMLLCKTLEW